MSCISRMFFPGAECRMNPAVRGCQQGPSDPAGGIQAALPSGLLLSEPKSHHGEPGWELAVLGSLAQPRLGHSQLQH